MSLGYRPELEELVSMGWVLAYCHVRGGGEKGRGWYHDGRGKNKMNTYEVLERKESYLIFIALLELLVWPQRGS